jgi:osomolarity two-component system phosphorelay intermediate protein YPD1
MSYKIQTNIHAQAKKQGPPKLSDVKDIIDESTFEQILEMDDEDDRDFSKGIVYGFFDQAKATFKKMEDELYVLCHFLFSEITSNFPNRKEKNLKELSSLGHFLKGSSATLGLTKVKDSCEKIQHYGAGKDEAGVVDEPDNEVSLKHIQSTLTDVKADYAEVEKFLRRFYGEEVKPEEEDKREKETKKEEEPTTTKEEKETKK